MKITRKKLRKIIRESLRSDEISSMGLYVIIGNAGHGRTNAWPKSDAPQAYPKEEAEKIAAESNDFHRHGYYPMHFFIWPLERALEKATGDTYAGFERLLRQHGIN